MKTSADRRVNDNREEKTCFLINMMVLKSFLKSE